MVLIKKLYEKGKKIVIVVLISALLFFLIYAMQNTYFAYTLMVVQQQQQHLLLISRAVAQNLQLYISEQLRTVSTLTQTPGFIDGMEAYYKTGEMAAIKEYVFSYTLSHQQGLSRIYLLDRNGEQIFHYNQYPFLEEFDEQALDMKKYSESGVTGIGSVFRISDRHYGLALANSIYGGNGHLGTMISIIDMDVLYKEFVAPLNVDKLGYITVMNRRKTVIMHPKPEMITFSYQTDIPDIGTLPQYHSLNEMLNKQYSNEEGTAIYDAYFGGIMPPEKEICAFSRMNLGGTSWYVSAAMPYSEAVVIENENLQRFGILAGAVFMLVVAGGMIIYTLQKNRQKLQIETRYLRDINSTLEELHQSREEVRHYQKLMTIGTLAGGIAHEFNNLLTPIMGYSEFLMEQIGKNNPYYDDIEEIFAAGTKAKEIVEQILPFSRKETDSVVFSAICIDVIVHDALKMIRLLIPSNIVLQENLCAAGVNVYGNATQLHQILLNLYSNAYQSMDENGGTLTVQTKKIVSQALPEKYRGVAEADFVEIIVEDTGCGMTDEVLHQIFNPFFTTKGSGEGTGLGLSVVKNILMNHNGFIIAQSRKTIGSRFFVYLPVTDVPVVKTGYRKKKEEKVRELGLLLVDDDRRVLRYLKKRLAHTGYRVDAYTDAGEALRELEEQPGRWDVAVLDYMMPKYKGTTLAQLMKKLRPTLGIIMITGMVERDALQMKLDGLIDHIIIKPLKFEELLTTLDWLTKKEIQETTEKGGE